MMEPEKRRYRFDDFELDVQNLRLTTDGETCQLEPKSFRLLQFLIENRGRAVRKDEIAAAVWPDAFVSDNSITRAITQIRRALDDDAKEPKYIETVPTIGYRFIGECEEGQNRPAVDGAAVAPSQAHRYQWQLIAVAALALVFLSIGAAWWMRRPDGRSASAALKNASFVQLTDQPGQELYPSLAPDGKSFVYASRASGNWDIYFQRVGGKNPVNLTQDSTVDDTQPAFSPDGERIAFRSERDGGGIFVMGASGENVKRITDFGYNPAWSPDGTEIVCASVIADPETRLSTQSQLFSVNIATGEKHPITPPTGNAVQPNWSPHGYRVGYWAQIQGRLNVWTIPAGGGEAVRVTNDASVDWNPVWSPDGAYLYFASDRGGSMNLWRVPIDEESGKVLGEMEPVTTPAPYAGSISFSRTGRQMAYMQRTVTANIDRVRFDPLHEIAVGQPEQVTQGARRDCSQAQTSPDSQWVVFACQDHRNQGDLFIARIDGSGLRQLTDDPYYDRWPGWSPDGKLIAFFSNRGGQFDVWTIRPDGGGLHQLTHTPTGSITHPVWSPDGKKLVYSLENGTPFVIDPDKTLEQPVSTGITASERARYVV